MTEAPVTSQEGDNLKTVQSARLARLLTEKRQGMEFLLESIRDGVMTIEVDRRITALNTAMESLCGYSQQEVLGRECSMVFDLRDREGTNLCSTQCPMLNTSEERRQRFERQGTIKTKDGRRINVAVLYHIELSKEGKPTNAMVIMQETSSVKQLDDLRETFLTMLGHELQTPISIIRGYASTLLQKTEKNDLLSQGLKVIEEESDRLSRMVNKLLFASRISTGISALKQEPIDLSALARKVVRRLKPLTSTHVFEIYFPRNVAPVVADTELIEEVISNLVENAIKYSPEGGKIRISGSLRNGMVRISISDEGIGIAADEVEHLFDRFHRVEGVESGTARLAKGMGLGLHICKAIVEAHKGTIEASSRGKGSQFTFCLPLKEGG